MNLTEMIQFFKENSGMFNLTDSQVTSLLNSGGKLLHAELAGHYGEHLHMTGIQADENTLDVTKHLASITEVYLIGTPSSLDRNYVPLTKYAKFADFIQAFPNHLATGVPTAYCLAPPMTTPDVQDMLTSVRNVERWNLDKFGSGNPVILLFDTRTIELTEFRILGTAQLRVLTNGTDTNYLCQQFPILLLHGALYFHTLSRKAYVEANTILSTIKTMLTSLNISSIQAQASLAPDEVL